MTAERSIEINGHTIEEFCWNGRMVVYVDNRLTSETYETACKQYNEVAP